MIHEQPLFSGSWIKMYLLFIINVFIYLLCSASPASHARAQRILEVTELDLVFMFCK